MHEYISGNASDNDILDGKSALFTDMISGNHTYSLKISAYTVIIQAIYNISEFFRYGEPSDTIPAQPTTKSTNPECPQ